MSRGFHSDRTLLSHVSCQSPSGTQGIVVALEGFLGTLVDLIEVHRRWRFRPGFLRGVFQMEWRSSSEGSLTFVKESPGASFGVLWAAL